MAPEALPTLGDHLRVSRLPLPYAHHGIYVGEGEVVHYSGEVLEKSGATIRRVTLEAFAAGGSIEVVGYAKTLGCASYWKAWSIALSALALSFLGLAVFGVGFLVTSVWFWQVAGFSFATVFTQRFELASRAATAGRR